MLWLFALIGLVLVVVIALVVVGGETARLATAARPVVFDMAEAVDFIAERLPTSSQSRLSHEDVRWVLLADADLLESRAVEPRPGDDDARVVDEVDAVARIIAAADEAGRDLEDEDVAAVLDGRGAYLEAIGAVGPEVDVGLDES